MQGELGFPFEAHYLGPGLHVNFDDLKAALQAELEKAQTNGCEGIIVAYGQCHPKIDDILEPYHAKLIECQSCVDAFITRKVMEKKAMKGFSSTSPQAGWMHGGIYLDNWAGTRRRPGCIWAHFGEPSTWIP